MPLAAGAMLGPYQLVAEIGTGGMGHVFRAVDTRLDRPVAVKVLSPGGWSDADLRQRFHREARTISSLSHPNICALYDVGEVALAPEEPGAAPVTVPYLVMELLEGETLRTQIDAGQITPRKASPTGRRSPAAWLPRTRRASSTVTSSRRTSSSDAVTRSRSSTSAWPRS